MHWPATPGQRAFPQLPAGSAKRHRGPFGADRTNIVALVEPDHDLMVGIGIAQMRIGGEPEVIRNIETARCRLLQMEIPGGLDTAVLTKLKRQVRVRELPAPMPSQHRVLAWRSR